MHESILTTLSSEHADLFLRLNEIENTADIKVRGKLFGEMKRSLVKHLRGEELTIYERLRHDVADEKALELSRISDRDHHHIRDYLQKLNLLPLDSHDWLRTYQEFRQFTEKHCIEEEIELFPVAKEDFDEFELEEFAFEYEEAKHQ
jgi:hypothetical protein